MLYPTAAGGGYGDPPPRGAATLLVVVASSTPQLVEKVGPRSSDPDHEQSSHKGMLLLVHGLHLRCLVWSVWIDSALVLSGNTLLNLSALISVSDIHNVSHVHSEAFIRKNPNI